MQHYFIYKLPTEAQTLFESDPKKFRTLYQKQFEQVVKQDILHLAEIATPVFEAVEQCNCYDGWTDKHYWYSIDSEHQDEAFDIFLIYCGDEIRKSYDIKHDYETNKWEYNKTILNSANQQFFDLLRTAFYYNNYGNKDKWNMKNIKQRYKDCGNVSYIYTYDFVLPLYDNGKKFNYKMRKKRNTLNKEITKQCKKVANDMINAKIKSVQDMNRKIIEAREFLAKHDKDFVRGY